MEELKILIGMVNQLPALALWVLVGFWAYKVICVGSIYGIIRFIVDKIHSYKTKPIDYKIKSRTVNAEVLHKLEVQIERLAGGGYYSMIGEKEVTWLKEKLDEVDLEKAKAKSLTAVQG